MANDVKVKYVQLSGGMSPETWFDSVTEPELEAPNNCIYFFESVDSGIEEKNKKYLDIYFKIDDIPKLFSGYNQFFHLTNNSDEIADSNKNGLMSSEMIHGLNLLLSMTDTSAAESLLLDLKTKVSELEEIISDQKDTIDILTKRNEELSNKITSLQSTITNEVDRAVSLRIKDIIEEIINHTHSTEDL